MSPEQFFLLSLAGEDTVYNKKTCVLSYPQSHIGQHSSGLDNELNFVAGQHLVVILHLLEVFLESLILLLKVSIPCYEQINKGLYLFLLLPNLAPLQYVQEYGVGCR